MSDLLERLLDGDHRALARTITNIENRAPGYRDLVSGLYEHAGTAEVIGITGSPGAGKSTLVDKMAETYRDRGETVGVIAIDPSSPFTGGAVLGDRIRMASNVGDMDVFFRSMSARGSLGGVSIATADAVKALDAFGKDRIIVETVGAGQNEIDIVKTADTVCVLVQPGSGDDVQMLKAGILEIADVFVVNKADLDGADRTVQELREMLDLRGNAGSGRNDGHHASHGHHAEATESDAAAADGAALKQAEAEPGDEDGADAVWTPPIVEAVATRGEGVEAFLDAIDDHHAHLDSTGEAAAKARERYAEEIRTLLREDTAALLTEEIDARGGIDDLVDGVVAGETDPYGIADDVLDPVAACLRERREDE
ncbi:methylmalonyl Co-A mutase-associated GTPase MeaB [Halococcus saccharolyticus]|uniref:Transport ATPase, component for LAO/AO transport systems n=1 Tax=Halococcus saccharolyticus DSM 5350 TaxID=1227455 RepID=M0MER2_9EURY|nr:methylmalonyl Co-A mutase-associated GTPase MeaB [Halococcus saccharolyticus]EMA44216.1 transport ATPase, component for LAO/AO transport systems [Halococcus saccharolyticus DSM 5350]